ncbi:MAG: cobalamin B12-binding domain-containing protein [Planctomycetes bacterium]|nr:cobalamin B12-binding domain-containing protein [Planctomycetota bacterium]
MRLLLVQPPHRDTFGYSMPPLGPLHLGAAARARGHDVTFVDLALLVRRGELPATTPDEARSLPGRCADLLLAHDPDVLGLGAMISSMPAALHLAAELHARRPGLPIVFGGQGPETVEERVLERHPSVAAVAVGEADASFVEWLDARDAGGDGADVPGFVARRDGRVVRAPPRAVLPDLDAVPSPAWDLCESPRAYADAAGGGEALFPIDLGRGCTYACTFCTTPVFWGRTARHLSPERAVDELDRLAALPGLGCAYVTHDLFTSDRTRVLAICAEKIRRGNTLPWECRTRIDLVDAELLDAMRAAGCRRILYGIESDVPRVLDAMHKGGRSTGRAAVDVRATLHTASRCGVASIVGTMAGVPGETSDDVERNLRFMAEVAVLDGVSLSMHWHNVTPGNGRAEETRDTLRLVDGLSADLVRGFDLPAGFVPEVQAGMIADDDELFAAFRVHAPDHADPLALYLLSRNAHLALEVLPRTLRALAAVEDTTLRALLVDTLRDLAERGERDRWPSEHFTEPRVLQRDAVVDAFAARAHRCAHPDVLALCAYEQALFAVADVLVLRFGVDPLPLLRAVDDGTYRPAVAGAGDADAATAAPHPSHAVLFTREGERVRARAVSPLLADALEERDVAALAARWPGAHPDHLERARDMARTLLHGARRASTTSPSV